MKDIIIIIALVLVAVICLGMITIAFVDFADPTSHYHQKAQVVEINGNIVCVETADGNLWEFETDHNYFIGEILNLCMNGNNTDTIYDDEIINVK